MLDTLDDRSGSFLPLGGRHAAPTPSSSVGVFGVELQGGPGRVCLHRNTDSGSEAPNATEGASTVRVTARKCGLTKIQCVSTRSLSSSAAFTKEKKVFFFFF